MAQKKLSSYKKQKKKRFKVGVLKASTKQTGSSNMKYDRKVKALPPGKRRPKKGNIYYEYRKSHSDVKGRDSPPTKKLKAKRLRRYYKNKK